MVCLQDPFLYSWAHVIYAFSLFLHHPMKRQNSLLHKVIQFLIKKVKKWIDILLEEKIIEDQVTDCWKLRGRMRKGKVVCSLFSYNMPQISLSDPVRKRVLAPSWELDTTLLAPAERELQPASQGRCII